MQTNMMVPAELQPEPEGTPETTGHSYLIVVIIQTVNSYERGSILSALYRSTCLFLTLTFEGDATTTPTSVKDVETQRGHIIFPGSQSSWVKSWESKPRSLEFLVWNLCSEPCYVPPLHR